MHSRSYVSFVTTHLTRQRTSKVRQFMGYSVLVGLESPDKPVGQSEHRLLMGVLATGQDMRCFGAEAQVNFQFAPQFGIKLPAAVDFNGRIAGTVHGQDRDRNVSQVTLYQSYQAV